MLLGISITLQGRPRARSSWPAQNELHVCLFAFYYCWFGWGIFVFILFCFGICIFSVFQLILQHIAVWAGLGSCSPWLCCDLKWRPAILSSRKGTACSPHSLGGPHLMMTTEAALEQKLSQALTKEKLQGTQALRHACVHECTHQRVRGSHEKAPKHCLLLFREVYCHNHSVRVCIIAVVSQTLSF